MKKILLLGVIFLFFGYSVLTTVQMNRLDQRLKQVQASYNELRMRHRNFASTVLQTDASVEAASRVKVDALREALELPTANTSHISPAAVKNNQFLGPLERRDGQSVNNYFAKSRYESNDYASGLDDSG